MDTHIRIVSLSLALSFFFGLCVGSKMGIAHTKKVYGRTHPDVFGSRK